MGFFSRNKVEKRINWIDLNAIEQLQTIKLESKNNSIIILKHSTRCSISLMAKNRLDSSWDSSILDLKFYYLDLIKNRVISNQIANDFGIIHESPQILVIKNGKCTYAATHGNIEARTLAKAL